MQILIADDHGLFREGLRLVLDQLEEGVQVVEADSLDAALDAARKSPELDIALLDLHMPGMQDTAGIQRFRQKFPDVPVVVVSASDDPMAVDNAISAGASGFICKTSSAPLTLSALRVVLAGGVYLPPQVLQRGAAGCNNHAARSLLTERQTAVLRLLAEGKPNKVIADELNLSEGTVKIHLNAIYRALKVRNRTEAVLAAQRLRIGASSAQ
jgi:DNA-binding NarL/FixJ family response regulator